VRKLTSFIGLILSIAMIAAGLLLYSDVPMLSNRLEHMESFADLLTRETLLLFVAADGFMPLMIGVLGLLLSLYGFAAACARKKQMRLLSRIERQRPAAESAPAPKAAAPAPKAAAPAPKATPAGKPQPTGVSTWICRGCGSSNPQSRDHCGTCGASRNAPEAAPAKPAPRKEPAPAPRAAATGKAWICPVCAMENKGDQLECVCCGEKKPANAQSAARPAAGTWVCPTCGMQNGAGAAECAVCGGHR